MPILFHHKIPFYTDLSINFNIADNVEVFINKVPYLGIVIDVYKHEYVKVKLLFHSTYREDEWFLSKDVKKQKVTSLLELMKKSKLKRPIENNDEHNNNNNNNNNNNKVVEEINNPNDNIPSLKNVFNKTRKNYKFTTTLLPIIYVHKTDPNIVHMQDEKSNNDVIDKEDEKEEKKEPIENNNNNTQMIDITQPIQFECTVLGNNNNNNNNNKKEEEEDQKEDNSIDPIIITKNDIITSMYDDYSKMYIKYKDKQYIINKYVASNNSLYFKTKTESNNTNETLIIENGIVNNDQDVIQFIKYIHTLNISDINSVSVKNRLQLEKFFGNVTKDFEELLIFNLIENIKHNQYPYIKEYLNLLNEYSFIDIVSKYSPLIQPYILKYIKSYTTSKETLLKFELCIEYKLINIENHTNIELIHLLQKEIVSYLYNLTMTDKKTQNPIEYKNDIKNYYAIAKLLNSKELSKKLIQIVSDNFELTTHRNNLDAIDQLFNLDNILT